MTHKSFINQNEKAGNFREHYCNCENDDELCENMAESAEEQTKLTAWDCIRFILWIIAETVATIIIIAND